MKNVVDELMKIKKNSYMSMVFIALVALSHTWSTTKSA